MSNAAALFSAVLFSLVVVSVGVYLVLVVRLLTRLRDNHQALYESLGSPSLFANNSPRNNLRFLGWLYRRDYSDLSDAATVKS